MKAVHSAVFAFLVACGSSASHHDAGAADAAQQDAGQELSCAPHEILCKRVAPTCPAMQVPRVLNGCYGECVPIASCVCHEPDDCPDSDKYTCFRSRFLCGPYVN
jgi:hypothetical protein